MRYRVNYYGKTRTAKRGEIPRVERVAEGEPSVSSPSPSKYAEEAGRDTGTVGSAVGERPSDGRGLLAIKPGRKRKTMFITHKYQCPFCEVICNGLTPFDVFDLNKNEDNRMDSDGYGWSGIASDDYVMCPECRNVFDIHTGNNGRSTIYERPSLPPVRLSDKFRSFVGIKKDVKHDMDDARFRVSPGIERESRDRWKFITDGFELYEKALRVEETRMPTRRSILLKYIWKIERMEEDEKVSHLASYNDAISEIIEILENNMAHPEPYKRNTVMILRPGDLGRDFDVEKQKNDEYNAVKNATVVLLVAEFYRRKKMFDRAIAILDGYDFVTPYPYQKMAGAIWERSRKNIPELFYLETDYFNEPMPLF